MVVNRRKKADRYRGSKTHGGGAKKKRRGAGNRGGKGMAGTGKRGDQKKPMIWKNKKYFGRAGFFNQNATVIKAVNIGYIEKHLDDFKGVAKDGEIEIDLKKSGFNKLLGGQSTSLTHKFVIKTEYASQKAVERVEKAGGKIILPETGLSDKQNVNT